MKRKNFSKKLSLNKNTVSHLNGSSLENVRGGQDACSGYVSSCLSDCIIWTCEPEVCTYSACMTACGSNPCC